MVRSEGGRWDVGRRNDEVYLERVDESNEQLFEDLLAPGEARQLAELLNKFADKADDAHDAHDDDEDDEEDKDRDDDKSSD